MKQVRPPRHALDLKAQREMAARLNALLKIKVFDDAGEEAGEVSYADGNTFLKLSSSSRWQKPNKELDPSKFVRNGTWVYVSPLNPIVVTGLFDYDVADNVKAYPGIWEAAQDIPAEVAGSYNVPNTDYPSVTPSGSPLSGDLDQDEELTVYWILICPTCGL